MMFFIEQTVSGVVMADGSIDGGVVYEEDWNYVTAIYYKDKTRQVITPEGNKQCRRTFWITLKNGGMVECDKIDTDFHRGILNNPIIKCPRIKVEGKPFLPSGDLLNKKTEAS